MTKSEPTPELVQMSPEWAQKLLDSNENNRHMRAAQVQAHMDNIQKGRWKVTHQGIGVDVNGKLVDGQHRLRAIVLSGQTVPIFLTEGLDPEVMDVIDTGARRTPGDVFTIHKVPNAPLAAATSRVVMQYRVDHWSNSLVPNGELLDFYLANAEEMEEAVALARANYKDVGMNPSHLCAAVFLTRRSSADPALIREWLRMVLEGLDLSKGDPAYILRRQFSNLTRDSRRMSARLWLGLYAKAWKIHALGTKVPRYLRFHEGDPLPNIERPGSVITRPAGGPGSEADRKQAAGGPPQGLAAALGRGQF